jgi:Flp pilus assembly CpaF family ATPase
MTGLPWPPPAKRAGGNGSGAGGPGGQHTGGNGHRPPGERDSDRPGEPDGRHHLRPFPGPGQPGQAGPVGPVGPGGTGGTGGPQADREFRPELAQGGNGRPYGQARHAQPPGGPNGLGSRPIPEPAPIPMPGLPGNGLGNEFDELPDDLAALLPPLPRWEQAPGLGGRPSGPPLPPPPPSLPKLPSLPGQPIPPLPPPQSTPADSGFGHRFDSAGLSDPKLLAGVSEIMSMIADILPDRAPQGEVMPLIRDAVRGWTQHQVRLGMPVPGPAELEALAGAVYDQRYGLGPLATYLRDPQVENVDINGFDHVWVTYSTGERVAAAPVAASDEALVSMIRTWATRGGQTARDFSAASPLVNVALEGGARMTATMSVTPRPCVSMRRHGQLDVTLPGLIKLGTLDQVTAAFLAAAVRSRCNIIVTGGVNAGKTTLLRALASEIPSGERIATLESEYELYLHELDKHPDVIAFESREANSEGAGQVSLHDLIAHALRHNPQRIIVGEVRRGEIMPMLEAMNSGQEGSMCTLHANSPAEAFDRILILGLRGGLALAERAIHILVGMAVDLIVQVRKRYDGQRTVRYVAEILEVMPPGDSERPAVNRLFLPLGPGGRAAAAHTPSEPMLARLEAAGFNAHLLDQHKTAGQPGNWR